MDQAVAGPPSLAGAPGDAVLTGVTSSLLCPREVFSVGSQRQGPRFRIRGVSSGVHIPLQNKPTGLQLERGKACLTSE